jgi:hypothetical protein
MMHPHNGYYLDADGEERMVIERVTGGFKEINTDHGAIHLGYGMCCHLYLATLAANGTKVWRLKGPTDLYAHIKSIQVVGQGAPLKVELIRNPTITNAGTEIVGAIQNLNDNSGILPQSKFYDGTVAFTGGSVWCSVVIPGNTTAQSTSGGNFIQNENIEYVTKDGDTDYILKLTNLSGSDTCTFMNVNMFFYEEPLGIA